jgi:8-amino-7-oxononanoate synthase
LAYAVQASLSIIQEEPERCQYLQSLIAYFKACVEAHQLSFLSSDTAIQSLIVGDADATLALQEALKDQGFLVGGIRPPTVPKNTGRLRITLSVLHTKAHIDQLIATLSHIRRDQCQQI